jgi:UDP-N-acetyl-D-mannosaminuronic acid dehydrogenase
MKFTSICVIGLGYIGLPTASTFATHGIKVFGMDSNDEVVHPLQNGHVHIFEPGLQEVVSQALNSGNLQVSDKVTPADAFIIAVPTPFYADKKADMRFVILAAESIVPVLREGNLVVLESTSPPQTTRNLVLPILEKSGLKAGIDFLLAYSPERVLPGQIMRELIENARVIGGINSASAEAGRDLYATFVRGEIVLTDSTTSEMVKLMENTYRDINIAAANEFSRLADRFGVDVWEAIQIANRHPRVKILNPGPGVGGHCISVDPWFFVESAPDITPLILTARKVNDSQPEFAARLVEKAMHETNGKKVACLGLSYKPDVDDLRESPAVDVVKLLAGQGAEVSYFEPFRPEFEIEGARRGETLEAAVKDADVVVLLVGHTQFKTLTPAQLAAISQTRVLVDTVNGWNATAFSGAGFKMYRLGVGKS